jgi:hemolysin III
MKEENKTQAPIQRYSLLEENLNIWSHGVGALLAAAGIILLVFRSLEKNDPFYTVGALVFATSQLLLYLASTIYHSRQGEEARRRWKVLDHCAIYLLIAGSYTPFTLVTLQGWVGWVLFGIIWAMAIAGIVLKVFFTGRFKILSTLTYVFMGWAVVFAFGPLSANFPWSGMFWLLVSGVAYTSGAVLYAIKAIPLNHFLFHLLVLVGSLAMFWAIYRFI